MAVRRLSSFSCGRGTTREKGSVEDAYLNARDTEGYTPLVFLIHTCFSQAPRIAWLLADAGADMTSPVQVINWKGELILNDTPLAFTTSRLRQKIANGHPATEEDLHTLEAIRRLLLRAEAVHAVSWLWPRGTPSIVHAAGCSPRPEPKSPSLRLMLPILKRRTKRRGVLEATLLRCGQSDWSLTSRLEALCRRSASRVWMCFFSCRASHCARPPRPQKTVGRGESRTGRVRRRRWEQVT